MTLSTVMSLRIRAFLKPHIFYPDSRERGLKPPLETSFGDRIHPFSFEWKADSCQKILRSQKYLDSRVDMEPQGGEVTPGDLLGTYLFMYLFSFAQLEYNLYTVLVGVCRPVIKILTRFQTKKR